MERSPEGAKCGVEPPMHERHARSLAELGESAALLALRGAIAVGIRVGTGVGRTIARLNAPGNAGQRGPRHPPRRVYPRRG